MNMRTVFAPKTNRKWINFLDGRCRVIGVRPATNHLLIEPYGGGVTRYFCIEHLPMSTLIRSKALPTQEVSQ